MAGFIMDGAYTHTLYGTEAERADTLARHFSRYAAEHDRNGTISLDNLEDLRAAGLLGLAIPQAQGGLGADLRRVVDIVARIAKGDPSTALILAMQCIHSAEIASSPLWPQAVRAEVLHSVLHGGALINALRVEPELGTPARGGVPATRVRRSEGRWLLSGQKIFSTGSSALSWGIVWGATEEDTPRIGQILVPLDSPGVRIEKSWYQLGMRASGSDTVIFEDVEIPERYLIGFDAPPGVERETSALALWHAILVPALYNAVALSARDWLVTFLKNRTPTALGKSLSTLPRFHTVMGEIDGWLLSNEALLDYGVALEGRGASALTTGRQIKRLVTENAIAAVSRAVEVTGNPGLNQHNPLERHYRDVLCGRIHTPQGDAVLELAGRHAFEVP